MFVHARTCLIVSLSIAIGICARPMNAQTAYPKLTTEVKLPQDEAPHQNSSEWWYFVGHLRGVEPHGKTREYGFELVIFQERTSPSDLAPAVYVAHHAITDLTRKTFDFEERTVEAPIPHQVDGFSLNVDQWTAVGGRGTYHLDADFADTQYGMHLTLKAAEPAVLHGDRGIIPYGPFGTSAYYSYTALDATGTIVDHGVPIKVTGISWQDRQWGNFNRTATAGWNWFSIQLDNNVQYMLYFIQDDAGNVVQKVGTKIVNGVATAIRADEMRMTPIGYFTSPTSGFTYPSKWAVDVPEGALTVTPLLQDQELVVPDHRTYFEGDSEITGTLDGKSIKGVGYTEVNPFFEPNTALP